MSIRILVGFGSLVLALAAGLRPSPAAEDTAALLKRQSQAFSDASATGNAAALALYLDDNVEFMDESGSLGTKKDLVAGVAPPPRGVSNKLVQSDWHLQLHGSVAVAAFTDTATVHFHGQALTESFRSTEVWLKEPGGWKMISSQTLAVQADPPAMMLPIKDLAQYAGTYSAGPGYDVKISRRGSGLIASVNGAAPFPLVAELKDVFFMPGQPRVRRIFERDAKGAVVRIVSRREGHDSFSNGLDSLVTI